MHCGRCALLFFCASLASPLYLWAQSPPVPAVKIPAPSIPSLKLDYPDSPSGLEHLFKDIIKALKGNNGARAELLLKNLALPEPNAWYDEVFGPDISRMTAPDYRKSASSIPSSIAHFLLDAQTHQFDDVKAVRFDKSCDDSAGLATFGILHARLQPAPLYELRLFHGSRFVRLFAFSFVNDSFRYITPPALNRKLFQSANWDLESAIASEELRKRLSQEKRDRIGGDVRAAKLIHRVEPVYPEIARKEHLQGSVRLHALIDKDGSLSKLHVITGYCSLSAAALEAVSQWRYSPTLFNGEPIEVDTEIDVTFSLTH